MPPEATSKEKSEETEENGAAMPTSQATEAGKAMDVLLSSCRYVAPKH